jgi:hypothetical protein
MATITAVKSFIVQAPGGSMGRGFVFQLLHSSIKEQLASNKLSLLLTNYSKTQKLYNYLIRMESILKVMNMPS